VGAAGAAVHGGVGAVLPAVGVRERLGTRARERGRRRMAKKKKKKKNNPEKKDEG
jgi:hypothetical protein